MHVSDDYQIHYPSVCQGERANWKAWTGSASCSSGKRICGSSGDAPSKNLFSSPLTGTGPSGRVTSRIVAKLGSTRWCVVITEQELNRDNTQRRALYGKDTNCFLDAGGGEVEYNDGEFAQIQTIGIEGGDKDLLLETIQMHLGLTTFRGCWR